VVAPWLEFPSQHDASRHVYYIFVHFGSTKSQDEAHDYLQFKTNLCIALTLNWKGRGVQEHQIDLPSHPSFCMPFHYKE
jgi:hypothetical protein